MVISKLGVEEYEAVAKLRAEIVRLLDEAFGDGYVVVVGYWKDPDGAHGWWNKRFTGGETPENLLRFIQASRVAEVQLLDVRRMAEMDAWLLYRGAVQVERPREERRVRAARRPRRKKGKPHG